MWRFLYNNNMETNSDNDDDFCDSDSRESIDEINEERVNVVERGGGVPLNNKRKSNEERAIHNKKNNSYGKSELRLYKIHTEMSI